MNLPKLCRRLNFYNTLKIQIPIIYDQLPTIIYLIGFTLLKLVVVSTETMNIDGSWFRPIRTTKR